MQPDKYLIKTNYKDTPEEPSAEIHDITSPAYERMDMKPIAVFYGQRAVTLAKIAAEALNKADNKAA